jgi:hypothetical protein
MELDLDAVPCRMSPGARSRFPALIDVALVVPWTPAATVERALADSAGALLESVRLFDVYASDQLGTRRKSLAYKLTFRASDRTLTVQEAVAARDAAVAAAPAGRGGPPAALSITRAAGGVWRGRSDRLAGAMHRIEANLMIWPRRTHHGRRGRVRRRDDQLRRPRRRRAGATTTNAARTVMPASGTATGT